METFDGTFPITVHPGKILQEILEESGLAASRAG